MILPILSRGIGRSVSARSTCAPEGQLKIRPSAAWQGYGYAVCGDGVRTPITDFCGSTPGDARGLACSRALEICSNRGGVRECDGVLMPFTECR
jgi:hypothetical protein